MNILNHFPFHSFTLPSHSQATHGSFTSSSKRTVRTVKQSSPAFGCCSLIRLFQELSVNCDSALDDVHHPWRWVGMMLYIGPFWSLMLLFSCLPVRKKAWGSFSFLPSLTVPPSLAYSLPYHPPSFSHTFFLPVPRKLCFPKSVFKCIVFYKVQCILLLLFTLSLLMLLF